MAPRTFAVATTVQDPMSADRIVETCRRASLDAFSRPGGAASSAAFAAAQPGFWDVLVPSERLDEALTLIQEELAAIDREAEENAKAAEEEALSGEHPVAE